jgi:hypothetical protein
VTEGERFDQIVKWISELSGQLANVRAELTSLRGEVERLHNPHHAAVGPHYWSIIVGALIIAVTLGAIVFYVGIQR